MKWSIHPKVSVLLLRLLPYTTFFNMVPNNSTYDSIVASLAECFSLALSVSLSLFWSSSPSRRPRCHKLSSKSVVYFCSAALVLRLHCSFLCVCVRVCILPGFLPVCFYLRIEWIGNGRRIMETEYCDGRASGREWGIHSIQPRAKAGSSSNPQIQFIAFWEERERERKRAFGGRGRFEERGIWVRMCSKE